MIAEHSAGDSDGDGDFKMSLGPLAGMAAESAEARRIEGASVNEIATGWLAPQYLLALRRQLMTHDEPERFELLRQAANDVVTFQRGGFWAARLELERERLLFQRQKHQDKLAGLLPEANQQREPRSMTEDELKACVDKVDEIFGLKPTSTATPAVGAI